MRRDRGLEQEGLLRRATDRERQLDARGALAPDREGFEVPYGFIEGDREGQASATAGDVGAPSTVRGLDAHRRAVYLRGDVIEDHRGARDLRSSTSSILHPRKDLTRAPGAARLTAVTGVDTKRKHDGERTRLRADGGGQLVDGKGVGALRELRVEGRGQRRRSDCRQLDPNVSAADVPGVGGLLHQGTADDPRRRCEPQVNIEHMMIARRQIEERRGASIDRSVAVAQLDQDHPVRPVRKIDRRREVASIELRLGGGKNAAGALHVGPRLDPDMSGQ